MFLNDARLASDGIAMLSSLLTHLNSSSNENLLISISYLARIEMRLGELIIDYMLRVCVIAQRMQVVTIDRIIPLFAITCLDHERYPGVKSRYFVGDTALVNCDLLQLSGLLSSDETRQCALGIPAIARFTTSANGMSNTKITLRMNVHPHIHTNPQRNHPTPHTHPQGGYLGNALPP